MPNWQTYISDDAPRVQRNLVSRWLDLSRERAPLVSDFDFDALMTDAHEPFLIKRITDPDRGHWFRFERVADVAIERMGWNFANEDLQTLFNPAIYESTVATYTHALETGSPHYWEKMSAIYGDAAHHYMRLVLPLVDDATGARNWLLGSLVWAAEAPDQRPR